MFSSACMTYLHCHVHRALIISARVVAVRSCLHRESFCCHEMEQHDLPMLSCPLGTDYKYTCSCCKVMPTQRELFCYHEMEQIKRLLEDPFLEAVHSSIM